jgi:RNA polymerase primary sigma factor
MPSKTAAKSKTKPTSAKKPAPKPAVKPPLHKASTPAKAPLKPAAPATKGGKPAILGKAPVSNVEAIKAVAIKSAAAKGAASPAATPADKEAEGSDSPLLDLSDAAVRKMIKNAKKRGYVTYEQLNGVLPSEEVTSEKIEDVHAMLNEMGINVVESEEAGGDEEKEDDDDDDAGSDGRGLAEIRCRDQVRTGRTHRRCADVLARNGLSGAALARGRDRDRQAHPGGRGR